MQRRQLAPEMAPVIPKEAKLEIAEVSGDRMGSMEAGAYTATTLVTQTALQTAAPPMERPQAASIPRVLMPGWDRLSPVVAGFGQLYTVPFRLYLAGTGKWTWLGLTTQFGLFSTGKMA